MSTEVQHVNVKIFAEAGSSVHWPALIPVFHRWIQNNTLPGVLIDVADYAHVPAGPGMMLIGHEAFYSVDGRANRLGMLYNRRAQAEGTAQEQIQTAYDAARFAAEKLAAEPEIAGQIRFDPSQVEVFVNDRLLAPNSAETWQRLEPVLRSVFGEDAELKWDSRDPRALFRVEVQAKK